MSWGETPRLAVGVRSQVLDRFYTFEYEVGLWTYGAVQVLKERRGGMLRTCKTVEKAMLKDPVAVLMRLQKLRGLQHPLLCGIREVLEDPHHYFIVSDRMAGGDVADWLDWLDEDDMIQEETCAAYVGQVLVALAYCHSHGCYHQDLRPNNVLLTSREGDARVMVSDVGIAIALDPESAVRIKDGGSHVSPELRSRTAVVSQPPGLPGGAHDIWSVGVLAQAMLLGKPPGSDDEAGSTDAWADRSDSSRNFVQSLLQPAGQRPTAARALQHPWLRRVVFQRGLPTQAAAKDDMMQRLVCYMLAILLVPVELAHRDLDRLRVDFARVDQDFDGFIPRMVAQGLLVLRGCVESQAEAAVSIADVRGTGVLDFSGLAAAALFTDMLPSSSFSPSVKDLVSRLERLCFEAFGDEEEDELSVPLNQLSTGVYTSIGRLMEEHAGVKYSEVLSAFDDEPDIKQDMLVPRLLAGAGRGTPLDLNVEGAAAADQGTEDQSFWIWRPLLSLALLGSCGLGSLKGKRSGALPAAR